MDDFVLVDDLGAFKTPSASTSASASASHYDDMFDSYFSCSTTEPPEPSPSSPPPPPVFDKPVFDDDVDAADPLDAIPLFEDAPAAAGSDGEDFLDSLGKPVKPAPEAAGFDGDLIPGFGGSIAPRDGTRDESGTSQEEESLSASTTSVSMPENPFVTPGATSNLGYSSFGLFTDYLDNMGVPMMSESTKVDIPSNTGMIFENSDIFSGIPKPMPVFSFASDKVSGVGNNRSLDEINSTCLSNQTPQEEPVRWTSAEGVGNLFPEVHFSKSSDLHETLGKSSFNASDSLARDMQDQVPNENQYYEKPNDVWLTVSDIILVTQPTSTPPPARPPPPLAAKRPPTESNASKTYLRHPSQGFNSSKGSANTPEPSKIDDPEDFVMAKPAKFANSHSRIFNDNSIEKDSSRATMGFMNWAEVEHSKGVNQEVFDSMFTRSQEYQQQEVDEKAKFYAYGMENKENEDILEHEQKQIEKEHEQRRREREREKELERERENARKKEEEEWKRREKEKEARQAVEKAVREARERATAEARLQAEREARRRAERAAVQKVTAEARERAAVEARERAARVAAEAREQAAVEARERAAAEARERAAVEARERAAAEARDRAEAETRERAAKAAAEAREREAAEASVKAEQAAVEKAAAEARVKAERAAVGKAAAEARRRAERAAVERATAEARQRAANEARERAAAEARARDNQHRSAEPDLESVFGMPSQSNSVPRPKTTTNPFDVQPQGSTGFGAVRRTPSASASTFTQPSSNNLMDDLSAIFGAPSSSVVFQEVEGESEERRKARLERHQRTMERAAKALAEKNERDLQVQREQEERHRFGETLDFGIKRWASGKEGNLRALLSTLQYVLWPECGWRPVSLTDLITAASVKKEYRKATLCIHPDKVQQKGANLQQKYIAEKVFDLLKEAWNKFNSEELF